MHEIPKLTKPQLVRCGDDWVVNVPAESAEEAIAFSKANGSKGFKVNAFTGATQQTIDTLLSTESPSILVVSGDITVRELGPNLKKLVLGIGTPWPDLLPKSEVEYFTCMESQRAQLLPQSIIELRMHGFTAKNLLSLHGFQQLTKIFLTEAKNLESLYGLPMNVTHLGLVKCRKLKDISALRGSLVHHLSIEKCSSLTPSETEEAQNWLAHGSSSV